MPTPGEAKAAGMPIVLEKVLEHVRKHQLRFGFEPSVNVVLDDLIEDCWDYVFTRDPRAAITGALSTELTTEHLLRLEADLHMDRWQQNFELNDPQPSPGGGGGGSVTPTFLTALDGTTTSITAGVFGANTRLTANQIGLVAESTQTVLDGDIGYCEIHRLSAAQDILFGVSIDSATWSAGTFMTGTEGTAVYRDGNADGSFADVKYDNWQTAWPQPNVINTVTGVLVDRRSGVDVYFIHTDSGVQVTHCHLQVAAAEITEPVRLVFNGAANLGTLPEDVYDVNFGSDTFSYDVVAALTGAGYTDAASAVSAMAALGWSVGAP